MPKNNTKGKRQGAKAALAQTDDDFDDMLAEVCAVDLAITAATSVRNLTAAAATTTLSSSSSSSTSRVPERPTPSLAAPATGQTVSDAAISDACRRNDTTQLRR
jgi:ADP-heptose:LPS heptosyltransferase